jgi:hypothetical protein
VSTTEQRKARKLHRCTDCSAQIQPGETYGYFRYLFEGIWGTERRCSTCIMKAEAFHIAEGCFAPWGGLFEAIRECAEEDPEFARNYLHARRQLRAKASAA